MEMRPEKITLDQFLFTFIQEEKKKYQTIMKKVKTNVSEEAIRPFTKKELSALEKGSASILVELDQYEEELTQFLKLSPLEEDEISMPRHLFQHVEEISKQKRVVTEFLNLQTEDFYQGEKQKEEKTNLLLYQEKEAKRNHQTILNLQRTSKELQKLVYQNIKYQEQIKWNFKKQEKQLVLTFLLFMTSKRFQKDPSFANTALLSYLLLEQLKTMKEPFYQKQKIAFYEDYQKELFDTTKEVQYFGKMLEQSRKELEDQEKDLENKVKPYCSKEEWQEFYALFLGIKAEVTESYEQFLAIQDLLEDSISENKARVKQKEQYNYENGSVN